MRLTVFDAFRFEDNGTVWTAVGYDDDNQEVRFGGDWRQMRDLRDAVAEGPEVVEVEVEEWQVLKGGRG